MNRLHESREADPTKTSPSRDGISRQATLDRLTTAALDISKCQQNDWKLSCTVIISSQLSSNACLPSKPRPAALPPPAAPWPPAHMSSSCRPCAPRPSHSPSLGPWLPLQCRWHQEGLLRHSQSDPDMSIVGTELTSSSSSAESFHAETAFNKEDHHQRPNIPGFWAPGSATEEPCV